MPRVNVMLTSTIFIIIKPPHVLLEVTHRNTSGTFGLIVLIIRIIVLLLIKNSTELIKQNKKWDLLNIIINFLITSSDFQHFIPVQLLHSSTIHLSTTL